MLGHSAVAAATKRCPPEEVKSKPRAGSAKQLTLFSNLLETHQTLARYVVNHDCARFVRAQAASTHLGGIMNRHSQFQRVLQALTAIIAILICAGTFYAQSVSYLRVVFEVRLTSILRLESASNSQPSQHGCLLCLMALHASQYAIQRANGLNYVRALIQHHALRTLAHCGICNLSP